MLQQNKIWKKWRGLNSFWMHIIYVPKEGIGHYSFEYSAVIF